MISLIFLSNLKSLGELRRFMCIASRLPPNHTPSMNLKSAFSWLGHLPLKRLQALRFQAFKKVQFRFQLLFLFFLSFEDILFDIGSI